MRDGKEMMVETLRKVGEDECKWLLVLNYLHYMAKRSIAESEKCI